MVFSKSNSSSTISTDEICEPLAHVDSNDVFVCFGCNSPSCICQQKENNIDKTFLAFAAQMQTLNQQSTHPSSYNKNQALVHQPIRQNQPYNHYNNISPTQTTRHSSSSSSNLVPNPFYGLLNNQSLTPPYTRSSTPSPRPSPPTLVPNPFFGLLNNQSKK